VHGRINDRFTSLMPKIRRLLPSDFEQVVAVYRDAVISQASGLYSQAQINAWAEHAERDPAVGNALGRGYGLASCNAEDPAIIEAFALLEPIDRLSLLYCRGRSCREGRASALLSQLQEWAGERGQRRLRTEASQLSRPLLERLGWWIEAEEVVIFAGQEFVRWRMIRDLP
jgi:hypothetical protein